MKALKPLLVILFVGIWLEIGSYFYGIRASDFLYFYTTYHHHKDKWNQEKNILIGYNVDKKIFPSGWSESSSLQNIENQYIKAVFFRVISNQIKLLPEKLVKDNLTGIYAAKNVFLGSSEVGGFYNFSEKKILINLSTKSNRYASKNFIRKAFHHELSSIMMHKYNFDKKEWRLVFPDNFLYLDDENPFYYYIYSQGKADKISDQHLYQRGLLKQYAETGLENDFNTYAEVIFTEPKKMKKLIREYPVIKRKYEVFKDFYLGIDKGFSSIFEKIDE